MVKTLLTLARIMSRRLTQPFVALTVLQDRDQLPCYVPVIVQSVHDGDTFRCDVLVPVIDVVMRDVTVRCAGYDAWEIGRQRRTVAVSDEELRHGVEARDALRALLSSGQVYVSPCDRSGMYDRLGLRVTVHRASGDVIDVASHMKNGGHCRG